MEFAYTHAWRCNSCALGMHKNSAQTFFKVPQAHLVGVNQLLPQNDFMFLDGNSLKCHRKSLVCHTDNNT